MNKNINPHNCNCCRKIWSYSPLAPGKPWPENSEQGTDCSDGWDVTWWWVSVLGMQGG